MAYYASLSASSTSASTSASPSASGGLAASTSLLLPVTRSRTGLFLSYRDTVIRAPSSSGDGYGYGFSDKGKGRATYSDDYEEGDSIAGEESAGLLGSGRAKAKGKGKGKGKNTGDSGGPHEVIQMNSLPPQWVDEADKVDEILERLKARFTQLDKLHAKHILPGFSDKTAEEREIANVTADITRELRKCQTIITRIAHTARNLPIATTSKEDRVMIQNVQTALATKVQNASTIFRKKQSNYLKQLRGHEIRNQDILAASGAVPIKDSYASVNDDLALSEDTLATSALPLSDQQQQQQQQVSRGGGLSLEAITQRDREITHIAESITDLADLFKDLSGLVIDQGTLLDRIDYNIENMARDMEGAVEELKTATKYQRRSGKRQVICLLILLVIGAIVILVYKPRARGQHYSDPPAVTLPSSAAPLPPALLEAGPLLFRRWKS